MTEVTLSTLPLAVLLEISSIRDVSKVLTLLVLLQKVWNEKKALKL